MTASGGIMKAKKRLRRVLKVIVYLYSATLLIHIVSALTLDTIIQYKSIPFSSTKIPAEMNGYKIAFITDTHSISAEKLEKVVSELNKRQPDLLVLGGDFHPNHEDLKISLEILSKVVTTDGIYGVEGNHDNFSRLFAAMEQYSIHPLSNSGVHIRDRFYLAGVEDLWRRNPDIEKAIADAKTDDFIIMIAHNPDVTMKRDTKSIDLVLSGHTHGGQITVFGIWAPALSSKMISDYGHRFMSGWAKSRDGVPVYVSKGTGKYADVPRIFARPQVIIFTLSAKSQ
jgi:predicted MPP superfamily phosphohydrolase